MEKVKLGKYRHFKGTVANVIAVAKHSETQEEYVVYEHIEAETGKNQTWIRPLKMFLETVEVNSKKVPRFELISSE